ncbi:MAG: hypothetical protein Tsb0013_15670 [Phycisphaerales bacterium]
MRIVWTIMVLVLLVGSGWVVMHAHTRRADQQQMEQRTIGAIRAIQSEIKVIAGTEGAELNGRGWPVTIDPAWFEGQTPANAMLKGARPWLEVAAPDQADLMHPVVRQAVDRSTPAFWYNPGNGVVRARVPVMISDKAAIEAYNRINGSTITSLVDVSPERAKR